MCKRYTKVPLKFSPSVLNNKIDSNERSKCLESRLHGFIRSLQLFSTLFNQTNDPVVTRKVFSENERVKGSIL